MPDVSGATGMASAEWYWFVIGDPQNLNPAPTSGARLKYQFSEQPLGPDIYAEFGNTYAMPVVGNFDPPVNPGSSPSAAPLTVNLVGTSGNDTFDFGPGATKGTWIASVDGSSQTFTAPSIQVTFNGLGGTDVAIVQGSGAGQSVTFHPGSAVATGSGYTVNVTAESITVGAGGGSGKVSMYGVAGKTNYFSGNATSAVMSDSLNGKWKNYYNRETGFGTVNAYSTPGNSDVAVLYGGAKTFSMTSALTRRFRTTKSMRSAT